MMIMTRGVTTIKEMKIDYLKASKTFNVPKRTHIKHIKNPLSTEDVNKTKFWKKTFLPPGIKVHLVTYGKTFLQVGTILNALHSSLL